jgi:hypothetical protein
VVLVDGVPLLYTDLLWLGSSLGSNNLLQVTNGIRRTTFQQE